MEATPAKPINKIVAGQNCVPLFRMIPKLKLGKIYTARTDSYLSRYALDKRNGAKREVCELNELPGYAFPVELFQASWYNTVKEITNG